MSTITLTRSEGGPSSLLKARRGAEECGPGLPTYLEEELKNVVLGRRHILANLGSWVATQPGTALRSQHLHLPSWLWTALHHFAPEAASAATASIDVLTATDYTEDDTASIYVLTATDYTEDDSRAGQEQGQAAPHELLTRLALTTAASVTLPSAEALLRGSGKGDPALALGEPGQHLGRPGHGQLGGPGLPPQAPPLQPQQGMQQQQQYRTNTMPVGFAPSSQATGGLSQGSFLLGGQSGRAGGFMGGDMTAMPNLMGGFGVGMPIFDDPLMAAWPQHQ
eukprot:gene26946-4568_t